MEEKVRVLDNHLCMIFLMASSDMSRSAADSCCKNLWQVCPLTPSKLLSFLPRHCDPGRARGERVNHTQLGRCLSQDKGLKGKRIFRQKSHRSSSPRETKATTDGQHPYDYKANGPSEATPTSEKRQQTLLEMQWSKPHQPKMPSFLCDARVSRVSTSNRAFPVVVIRYPEIETLIVKVGAICSWTLIVLCVRELSHKILLGWDFMQYHGFTPDPRAGCLTMRQGNILFQKSHAVALVDKDGLIWRHRRRLMTEEGAKQALVPRALKNEVLQKGKRDEPVQFHGRRHNIVVVKY
ncbi:hypothetical protein T4E_2460 [Trichinella pseudospiralis]|uniref:Uncharacterized protein n=1 Tax=Trichinella pseudospiralis TaxID=6337 RepID=A0A0V0XYC5_TRIPS|nr:hypothetical protein T4E_2460 [Trichinella pseudospiralis]